MCAFILSILQVPASQGVVFGLAAWASPKLVQNAEAQVHLRLPESEAYCNNICG